MLSFEDFFIKKKIDLNALQSADQILYNEFRSHYAAMGEKSFDHSKKFWFNKLRKSYLLPETEIKPAIQKTTEQPIEKNKESISVDTVSTTSKSVGFKPRFKAAVTKTEDTAPVDNEYGRYS